LISLVFSVGLSRKQYNIPSYEFKPGLEFTQHYSILHPTKDTVIHLQGGEFTEYIELSRTFIPLNDEDKSFTLHFKLPKDVNPENFRPGNNGFSFKVRNAPSENVESEGLITVSTGVTENINIYVPYPGYYAEFSKFNLANVNAGQNSTLNFEIWNRGKQDLLATNYEFKIKDKNQNTLFQKQNNIPRIKTQEKQALTIKIPSSTYNPGEYFAELKYYYTDKEIKENTTFKVGTLNVDIINHTKTVYNDSIQKFDINIQSDWNEVIPRVYAEVTLNGTITSKSSPEDLSNFQEKTISAYLDTTSLQQGNYTIDIKLFYADKNKQQTSTLEVLEKIPPKKPFFTTQTIMIMLIIISLLLLTFTIYILLKSSMNNKNVKKNKKQKK
jgi:hypothetical protein